MHREALTRPRDDASEEHREEHRAQGERSTGDDVVGRLGIDESGERENEGLRGDDADDDRPAADDDDREPGRDEQPGEESGHVVSISQVRTPSKRGGGADREEAGREEDAHLRDERLDEGERAAEHDEDDGQKGELEPHALRVRNEDLRGEHEHDPVPGRGTPLQEREIAPAVLEHRPSWIIVSSRCVSGLSNGCRPVSARTTSANPTAPSARPGDVQASLPAVPATIPVRSVVPATSAATARDRTSAASVKTLIVRSRLAPMSAKPFSVSHAAAHTLKRASASRPPSASMLWPTPRSGVSAGDRDEEDGATSAAAATGGASL